MHRLFAVLLLGCASVALGQQFDERPLTRGSFQRAASVALPSVVQITVRATTALHPLTGQPDGGTRTGSGIIISIDGLVATNRHVVDTAIIDLSVRLFDDREFKAVFVAKAPDTDIAVIRIENPPSDLVPASLRDTSDLVSGELVLAIGAPRGLRNSITQGVVSAIRMARDLNNPFPHPVIQTDADINPGNSGGPLIDLDGFVIGMNSFIATDNGGGSIGLGFSIPADIVKTVTNQLAPHDVSSTTSTGEADGNGWIGVLVQDLDTDLRTVFRVPPDAVCVLVTGTEADSPARHAGLAQGDCIVSHNQSTDTVSVGADFLWDIRNMPEGTVLKLSVLSRGISRTVTVTVTAQP